DVQVDDALAAVQQVAVLGRHRQPARTADPHHVGAQIGKHHPGMGPRSDAAEVDNPHPGQGPPARHDDYFPFVTCSTRFRSSWVAESIVPLTARLSTKPGSGTFGSTLTSNLTSVLSPFGTRMYLPSCDFCWAELTSVQLTSLPLHV